MSSLWIDKKYLSLVSSRLEKFKWKGNYIANFRCPLCGDSKINKNKTRGYTFVHKGVLFFKCHNCTDCRPFGALLRELEPGLFKEYSLESWQNTREPVKKEEIQQVRVIPDVELGISSILSLPDTHLAKIYVRNRKIPFQRFFSLYYTNDFKELVDRIFPESGESLIRGEERLVIPYFTKDKKLLAFQGRSLDPRNPLRYITITVNNQVQKAFGLEWFDKEKQTYLLEGPLDSLFIRNALAVGSSSLSSLETYVNSSKTTYVYDNQRRNKELILQMEKTIEEGKNIFIWPAFKEGSIKDINDIAIAGMKSTEIVEMINRNTHSHLEAKLLFTKWKKF